MLQTLPNISKGDKMHKCIWQTVLCASFSANSWQSHKIVAQILTTTSNKNLKFLFKLSYQFGSMFLLVAKIDPIRYTIIYMSKISKGEEHLLPKLYNTLTRKSKRITHRWRLCIEFNLC